MKVLFFASGAFAEPTLRWLAQSGHEIALVVSQPAKTAGRGRHVTCTPVTAAARKLGLEVAEVEDVNTPEFVRRVDASGARLGLVIAFGQKLGPALLGSCPSGFINLHASLLPRLRGAAPVNWAILRGEERTGCTVFRLVERMDAGPILVSRWTSPKDDETAGELHDRLAGIGVDAVRAAFDLYEGASDPPGTPQIESEATFAPKLKKVDGVIDFARSARDVVYHILGMTPWPGATTRFISRENRWEDLGVVRARCAEGSERPSVPPGTIDARRYVAAADAFVELLEVKPSSGRVMSWADYVNGRHVKAGDRFEASKS